jgi:hypothetical protein
MCSWRRFVGSGCTACLLGIALGGRAAAQFGATVDLRTGPIAWDHSDGRDPLLNGGAEARYLLPTVEGIQPELRGQFGLSTGPAERAAVGWDIGARLHTTGRTTGVWLGVLLGAAGTGSSTSELTRLEGGVRRSIGPARVNVWVSRTGFGGRMAPQGQLGQGQDTLGSPDTLPRRAVSEYTDLGSQVTFALRRYELGVSLIHRIGSAINQRLGWEVSGTWWVAPSVGVVGATGHSLPQFGFSLPGGRYGTVGLRLALGSRTPTAPTPSGRNEVRASAPRLLLADRRLTIQWPAARQAEVMGDFTDWEPRSLQPVGEGGWTLPVSLSPGVHHLNVRFDGGPWLVPSGAVAVDDGYGGRVGLIVVR